ncbi:uncharacterized protein BDZ99DRAFT_461758 [Mytilinidion resinicola]|uniref:Multiple myeloma tumor-associated protein 2-like N-terminal domain-containing protein n=1 Tax=Mytilinidion resinicola TaxID=574789 RepID=A0A6A6YSK2_9PEZI|nr:uncharacterized protein BDZ99DRAFT_461758 [Mytilinidion resinicola]KAF2811761.1 hypothetical protein BDZ99DRAFT_461758 [Mytilinidion resinicola]
MDLLQSVRKEGSRGGRADFKWEDVKADSQRENYLGHSLMAPVGRWQKGRDLNWYAKGDEDSKEVAAQKLAEEKRKLKEAEEDAMLVAMGLPVPQRASTNANMVPVGERASVADVKKAMAEVGTEGGDEDTVKGVGFGAYNGRDGAADDGDEVLEGSGLADAGLSARKGRREDRDRDRDVAPRERRRDRREDDGERHRRKRSRSRSREHHRRRRSRSRDRDCERRKHRSRSYERRREEDHHRERRIDPDAARSRPRSRDRVRDMRPRRSRSPYDRSDGHRRR